MENIYTYAAEQMATTRSFFVLYRLYSSQRQTRGYAPVRLG